jgi:hypothetical protein
MAEIDCRRPMRMREDDNAWRRQFPDEWRCFRTPDPWHLLLTCEGCDVSEAHYLGFHFVPQTPNHQRMCQPPPEWASALPPLHQTTRDPPFH